MHTNKKTDRSNLNNSLRYKNKKLIKSISEKFIEEYAIKLAENQKQSNNSRSTNKTKKQVSNKSSISPSLIKTTTSQISNISTCSNTSNNTKKQIIHRNRNKPQIYSSNTKLSTNSLKFTSYSSAFNMSSTNGTGSANKINVMKKKLLHSNVNNNSTFVEIDEEMNQSSINKQGKKMNRSVSQNSMNESSYYKEYIPVLKTKHLKTSRKDSNVNKSICNLSSQNALSNSQGNILYYKKQIRLNSSMDNALNKKVLSRDIKVNSSMQMSSKSINDGSFLKNTVNDNISSNRNIEDPEEMHFAFVELCQRKKRMYYNLEKKFNKFSIDEDILQCA